MISVTQKSLRLFWSKSYQRLGIGLQRRAATAAMSNMNGFLVVELLPQVVDLDGTFLADWSTEKDRLGVGDLAGFDPMIFSAR